MSKYLSLNTQDFIKGLVVAVLLSGCARIKSLEKRVDELEKRPTIGFPPGIMFMSAAKPINNTDTIK